jgi:hypothetical protein
MSPTILRYKNYRFLFFSREEQRIHVHVTCPDGEAKYWIEPQIELARYHGLTDGQLNEIRQCIEEHQDDIRNAWTRHFGR